jgi:hypothetical protein
MQRSGLGVQNDLGVVSMPHVQEPLPDPTAEPKVIARVRGLATVSSMTPLPLTKREPTTERLQET